MAKIERRTFFKGVGLMALGAAMIGSSVGLYATRIEPGWIDITSTTFHLPRLQPAFAGYRIVQLTDLHVDGVWMDKGHLETIVALANEQQPDMIVITGDFVTYLLNDTRDVLSALRALKAPDGVFGVLGNHDHWNDAATVSRYITAAGVIELKDAVTTIKRGDSKLHLVGMDDLWVSYTETHPSAWAHEDRLNMLVEQLPTTGAAILLVHEPDFADVAAANGRIDLQLSGHSHGGQINLPIVGAPITPPLGRKYPSGFYQVQSLHHYTSRGLGMLPPQVRFHCRPELAVFICQPA